MSGTGNIIAEGNLVLYGGSGYAPTYTGTVHAYKRMMLGAYNHTTTGQLFYWGGALVMHEGSSLGLGYHNNVGLNTRLIIDGDFSMTAVYLNYDGDVELTADRVITTSGNGQRHTFPDVGFGPDLNLTGAGALTLNAVNTLVMNSGSNVFSGGFTKSGGGTVRADLHSDLVMGALDAGHNYYGSGSVTVAGGNLSVANNGYDAYLRGLVTTTGGNLLFIGSGSTVVSGTVLMGNGRSFTGTGGGAIEFTDASVWQTTGASGANLIFDGDLVVNTAFVGTGATQLYARPTPNTEIHITSTMSGGITNVGTFFKQSAGEAYLHTPVHLAALNIQAGNLIIGGHDYMLPRTGTVAPTLAMGGGLLTLAGGSTGSPNVTTFNTLTLTGNAGLFLNEHSSLLFKGGVTWSGTGFQLSLTNDSGIWSTSGAPGDYDTYVYFTSTAGFSGANAWRLDRVSFTGYEAGAELVQVSGSNLWFLAPTGASLNEWVGARGTGIDTDRLWGSTVNWVGGVSNAAGRTAVVRDADGLLNGNRILVDGAFTVGQLLLESSGGQVFTVGGTNAGVLVFDNGGDNAVLSNSGNHTATLETDMRLDGGLDFRHTSPNTLYFNSRVSGSGGIVYSSNTLMFVGTADASGTSASDFTGGFRIVGSTATTTGAAGLPVVRIAADGSLFGSGSYNGTDAAGSIQSLTIGDGTPGRWYYVGLDTANSVRVVDASLRIAGNWNFGIGGNNTGVLTFRSADPGYVESGTWTLQGSYNSAVLNIEQDLQGPGGLRMSLYGMRVNFYGNNTFAGDVILGHLNNMSTGVGSDSALGRGVVRLVASHRLDALGGARTISNEFEFNSTQTSEFINGSFILNHSGTSTLARDTSVSGNVVVSTGHVFSGAGSLVIGGAWRLEGAHEYSGNTSINRGSTLSIGDAQSISSGTLFFIASNEPQKTSTLASWGGPVTLANTVVFNHYNIGLDGAAGALTLSQTSALPVTLTNNTNFTVTGSVVFGENFRLTGAYGINKTGAGMLTINNNNNDYTGDTTITNGTLRVNAGGDIALGGATAAGEHYLGMGHVKFTSGNFARMLELVVGGTAVDIHGNLALNGNSAVNTASINITDTAGAISGANIGTNLVVDTDSTISGNAYGYLRTAGDVIKTGAATLHWTGGNIVTSNLVLREGALDLGSVNSTRTGLGNFTLGSATLNVSGSQTFAGTLFNLAGSGTINMNGASGSSLLTFADVGSWNGTLDIINWNGDSTYGGGLTQVRFVNDVLTAFDHAKLATISFYSSGIITYAPGARVIKTTQQYYELIPTGVSSIWNGNASLNNWSSVGNWETNVAPGGPGSVAVFSTTLQLNGTPVNIDVANLTLGGLMFMNDTGENYSIGGLAFTFEQMDSDEVANLTLQNNNSVTIANAGVALANRLVVSTVGTGTLTINAPVSGTQGMIKSGAGELVLASNASSFSGGITLLDGTLTAAASSSASSGSVIAGPLGTGTLTVAGTLAPTLAFTAAGAQTIDNAINLDSQLDGTDAVDITLKLDAASGNETTLIGGIAQSGSGVASLEKTGDGALTLAAASAHTGTTTVSAGTLAFTAANAIASSTAVIVNATLATGDIEQTLTNLSGTGHIIAGADGNNLTGHVIALNTEATTYSGSITGDGALTKTGTGALTLSGTNTHTGMTTINGGVLAVTGWTGSASAIHIGGAAGTSGTVNVSGYFGAVGNLYVGNSGTGFMTITDSGTVQNVHGYIGNNSSRLGVVTVTDSSVWQNTGNLYVGNSGTGFLSIEGNGTVQNTTAYIGYNTSSSGSVMVTGSGFWLNTADLYVGHSSKGFLTIEGSGSVQSSQAYIGLGTYGTGTVTVTGSGLWDNMSGLGRMSVNKGHLAILEKGTVRTDSINIGPGTGNQGSVTVGGSGSLIARFIGLAYSGKGKGYLTITDNGFVSGEAYISDAKDGYGSVLIEKSGHWQTNKTYYAGRSGTGVLTITDSGSLTATGAFTVGYGSDSLGNVTVEGSGLLRAAGVLTIGSSGRGNLTIEDNAIVNTGWVRFAEGSAASGILNLNGGLLQTGSLAKVSGTGTINFNSGTLQATKGGASFISGFSGAKGSLVIQSGGAFIDSNAFSIGVARNSGFSGAGVLHKLGAGTLTLAGTSTYTGGTEVEAGSLVIATLSATTSSQTIGTGTLAVHTGASAYVAPPAAVANYTFDNDLSGSGLFDVNLYVATNTLTLTGNTDAFTGTANFRKVTHTLSGGAFNAATLISSANSTIIAGSGSNRVGNFVFNGGNVGFDLSGTGSRAAGWIDTGALELKSGNVRVDLAQVTGSSATPLLQQDEGVVRQLINAQSITGSVSSLKLNGGAVSLSSVSSAIRQSSTIAGNNGDVATGYYAVAMTSTGAAGTGTGLYLGSVLTRLDLRSGYTTILDGDTDNVAGGDEFHAQITGAGNLGIQATGTITLNAANTHTGTTTVFDGALRLGIDGALGKTARLDIHSGAIADINGRAQTLGAFSGSAGSTLLVNGGTVTGSNASVWTIDGLVDATAAESVIQAAGTGMTANINSGTLLLANSSTLALGSGALTVGSGNTAAAVLDIKDSLVSNQHATIGGLGGNGLVTISGSGLWRNTGNLALGSAGAGALAIGDSGSVAVGGIYSQGANSTLTLTVENNRGLGDAFITANSATVGGTISVDGFGADSVFSTAGAVLASDQQVLIKTTGTISGTFASATLDGFDAANLPDYLYGGIYKTADAKQYLAGVNLSWLGGETDGHGNFTVASGTSFDMDISLADQNNSPYASGWDGRSLTVTASNSGTLVLSASNSFTGDIFIRNGALVAATGTNAGWALGSGANTVYYDGAAGSAARLVFATGGTMTQRQIISAGANATLEAVSGADLTVTTAPLGSNGGAVYVNAGGTFGITGGVTFTGNRGSSVSANGAAIYNAGELSATGAIFASNTTAGYAGAIYNTGTMSLASGTLAGNYSAMQGGAVYNTGTIRGSGLLFASNTSGSNGGAVFQEGATAALNLQSSVFDGNYASSGGAIWNGSLARVEIANSSTFSNNRAALKGGAVYTTGAFTGGGVVFASNTSAGLGGAIYAQAADAAVTLRSGTFANNYAASSGGAFHGNGATLAGVDLTFDGNVSGSHGGAIHNSGVISGTNLVFTSNTARAGSGGAIHNVSSMTVDITTGSFSSNRAGGGGGAIYTAGTVELNGIVTFADNRAGDGGAVAVAAGGYFTNTGMVRFLDNRSTSTGGAISVGGTVNIDGALFERNYAAASGGAIAATGAGTIIVSNALFVSNSSNGTNGGAITVSNNSRATVTSSTFTNNRAASSSGAIAAFPGGRVSIEGSRFESNHAVTYGGVSENYLGTLTINNSVFVSNSANSNGGVIANCGTMGIAGSVFTGNYSGGGGGALSNYGAAYVNTLTDVIFTSNTAAGVGGAIYNQGYANTVIAVSSGSTLAYTGNTARGNTAAATDSAGGFLYAHSGSVVFDIAGALAIGDENSIAIRADGIAAVSDTIAFTKTGTGTLTLWANNAYTGTTFVNAGKLSLRGYLASAHTIVAANSTLGGTGTTGGNVTILSHGHIAPGASPGRLTILGNLTLENNAQLDWELGERTDPGHMYHSGTNDLLVVGGNVTVSGTSHVNITTTATLSKGEYDLIKYTGTLGGDSTNFAIGTISGDADTNLAKYKIVTSETNWIKLAYDLNGYAIWDGADKDLWDNGVANGGNGTWYAPGALSGTHTAWTGTDGNSNGEWEQGEFAIFKGVSGTVTVVNSGTTIELSGAQFRTDGYLLTGGTLTTSGSDANIILRVDDEDYQTPGLLVTTTIATTITGTHGVEKTGGGTLVLSGSNDYDGITDILDGMLVMADEHALSVHTATIAAGATLRVATGSMTFSNTLTGDGLLEVDLASSSDAFSFSLQSFSPSALFSGTAKFLKSAFTLNNNALANADVILGANNTTTVATGTHAIGNLAIDGGALVFTHATGTRADGIIRTGTLDAIGGTVTITSTYSGSTGLFAKPLLQQDEGYRVLLIDATAVTGTNFALADGATTTAAIKNTASVTTATATYAQTLDYTNGLSVAYELTQLDLLANQTTTLADDTEPPAGGSELHALITGAGNLQIDATSAITLNNAANTHTGTTLVNTGTLVSGTSNALGNTAWLAVTATAAYNLNGHTQTIANGAQIDGTLHGSGSLGLGGLATITSTNANFAANIGVTGTTIIASTQALGTTTGTIAIAANAALQTASATGAFTKTLAGSGAFELLGTSTITLAGDNTAYSGTFAISAASRLAASTNANLGNAALSGSGVFEKIDAATALTIDHANTTFTGTTLITGGTLRLENLQGVGTSAVINNAILDLAATGTFANNITGTGTSHVSSGSYGSYTVLTGTNSTDWNITGAAQVSSTTNLGAGNTHIDGELSLAATTAWAYSNTLTGTGTLAVNLSGSAFTFSPSAFSSSAFFEGVLALENTTYNLFHNTANESALANATLRTQAGSIINLGTNSVSGTMKINGLELIGGTINVHLQSPDTAHVLEVNELTVANADSVSFNLDTSLTPAGAPTTGNFLDQDSGTNSIQLVKAASLDEAGKQMNLLFNGAAPSNTGTTLIVGDGHGNTDIEATYNYAAFSSGSAHVTGSAHSNHIEGPGIYVDYLLTELKTNTNLVLDNAGATDTVLGAKITGTGNLTIQARDTQIFLSHSNAYTGTTTISSGTLIAAANDALGQTAHLLITGTAAYNLNGHTQTIANGAQIDGTLHGSGSLGLGGLATITSTNAAFAANVGVTGTTIINNTQALGNTGTIAIASGATLSADGATGDLSKTLAGQGGVSLVNSATITLTADNTNYSGTFAISATSRLAASTNANLGNAALSGSGVFEKINAATALTIDHANNTFTGTTLITGGTLRLENLQGVGTSAVINNANLDLAATGTFSNNITGTGTSHVTQGSYGSYTVLTGTNSTDWHITGAAQVSSTANLGAGATHIDGLLDIDSATAWLYTNALSGTGILKVDTNNNAFSFSPSVFQPFSPFRGVLELHSAAFDLSGTNTAVLTEATLQIDENAFVATGSGAQQIGNLTLTSGTLGFTLAASGTEAAGIIRTGTLAVHDTVLVIDTGALPGNTLPLLQQDEPHTITLVESTTLAAGGKTLITGTQLVDQLGNQITDATQLDIAQSGDIVASGTYDFAAVASNTGIHLSYELTALDLLAGKTTLLTGDIDDAILNGADELHAKVSGSGNLRVEAAGSITLNNTNTYTGTTTLATGTLIAGANEALGQTSFLVVEIPATYDLNGNTQTLANGGQIDGLLTGTGALTLSTGTLLVTSSNTGFTAQTNINAPATARITDIDALGSAAIELEGILIVDTTGTGALQNTLSGTGTLIKDNTGIVAINHSNAGFTGDASIDEGRLIAAKIDALGTAAITVADGAAFEQLNVTGTLQNELHGEGLHQLTNSTLTLANPAGYTIAATTLDATSALILETTGYRFRALELNNGALAFAATAPTAAAQIDTLGDTTGRFILNAKLADITAGINPAGTVANHLAIADAGAGRHDVYINPISEPPAAINFAIELITTGSGSATFAMANPGGKLEYDLTTIELVQGDGSVYTPDTNKWYLSDRNLSHAADAIINTASTLALDWAYALDALHLRLGDIRAETLTRSDNPKSGNLWIRARGYRLNAANDLSGMSFRQYGWGMTGGADKIFETETGVHLLGAFIDTGGVDRDFDNGGNGKTRNVAVGAYLTLLKQTGWHLDVVARLDRYSNEFEAKAVDGRTTRGKYTTGAQSLSAEFGRRLQRTDGWWVEPGVQVAVLSLDSANYSTQATADQRAIDVHVDSSKTWQYRALVRFGKQIPGSRWAPYGKFAAVSVESSDGEISAHGKTFEANYDGKRVEFGLGTSYRINDISQVYFDYEYAKAQFYERPWSLNLGYRRFW
ncbi:autotransporter-associated beta strand repeat-containing protein [Ereboglobus luteus]|uniref:Autotransporter domain-containing protein n=1 Tax=Ereboglobus luteus TaxID=1796921 RepID=A0A2U8E4G0_9BACT|nr:autotransporter-associated beta strand repeat-containing protein [Ereboglobus luteus]AWI09412.1 hypothetical protein CKA38_09275 [Ereboglobus luteus]